MVNPDNTVFLHHISDSGKTTEDFRSKNPQIPWEKIFGMRNKLVHDYMGIQLPVVWQTVQEDIPGLKRIIDEILN